MRTPSPSLSNNIILVLLLAVFVTVGVMGAMSASRAQLSKDNPYLDVQQYQIEYCKFRDAFVTGETEKGRTVPEDDPDMEYWLRNQFDAILKELGFSIVGEPPEQIDCDTIERN